MIGIVLLEALCLVGLARLAVVYHRESQPAPELEYAYEPEHRADGDPLKRRRSWDGRPAMRDAIATMSPDDPPLDALVFVDRSILIRPPVDLVPTPQWTPQYRRPEWVEWTTTDDHDLAEIAFFGGQPDDLAVQRRWDDFGAKHGKARTGATR